MVKERIFENLFLDTLFHLTGNRSLVIENYKGIISYRDEQIIIKANTNNYIISGRNLVIDYYSEDYMKITGNIMAINTVIKV